MGGEQQQKSSESQEDHEVIIQLENGLGVRRYRETDTHSTAFYANNKKIWDNLRNRMPNPYNEDDAKAWISHTSKAENCVRCGPWTLESGSQGPAIPASYGIVIDDEVVGSIGLEFGAPGDVYARTAEVGYWLGEQYWGKGIMTAVLPAFVQWAWNTFEILVRLNAETFERNAGSRRCLEKAGFQVEGVRRNSYMKNGIIGNTVMLGAIRPGFEA